MSATNRQRAASLPALRQTARALAPFAFWAIALAAAATVLTEQALPLALLVCAVALAVRWLDAGAPSARTSLDWPIAGLAVMAGLTLVITPVPTTTWPQVARLIVGFALFYAVANWAVTESRQRLTSLGLVMAGLALSVGALFSVRWETYKFAFLPRELYEYLQPRVADYVNPNVMAGYLALLLPCVIAPLVFSWGRLRWPVRALGLVALAAMCAVLLLTQSRAGMLAAGIGVSGVVGLRWGRSRAALVALGAAALAALALSPWLIGAVTTNVSLVGGPQRVEIYQSALAMIRDHWPAGVGMGAFNHVLNERYPLKLSPPHEPHAHNLFLQVAIDLGLPGLIAWCTAMVAATLAAWRAFCKGLVAGDAPLAGLAAGLLGSQLVLVTHGALDAVTWGMVRPAVLVWALWGIAVALARPADLAPSADER